jgi:hypothetical protein
MIRRPPWVDLAILAAGVCAVLLVGWLIFIRPGAAQREVAEAKGAAVVATAEAAKARDSVRIVERTTNTIREIERATSEGNAAILAAPGAAAVLPADVAAAGRHALCLHALYHGDAACRQLPGAAAGQPEGADAGRPAAG